MRFETVGAPPAVMMSPQSPVASEFVKLTAMALLQQPATVEVVVEDVDVDELEVVVRDVEVDVLVRDVEVELEVLVRDVDVEVDVLVRDVEVELEVDALDVLVRDVEVEEDVDVVAGGAVELLVELVDVVPPDGDPHALGAGESLRLSTPSTFRT